MNAAVLLLADSRLPAGGHAHSGQVEPAVVSGLLSTLDDLAGFLRGRLATAGLVTAALAAAACRHARDDRWAELDAEADARTPSPAQRDASRKQGRSLMRAGRATWPAPWYDALGRAPHHPLALGAVCAAAGGTPEDAALVAAQLGVTGSASAAVRLLAFDPLDVHALQARLADDVTRVAAEASADVPFADLPAHAAPTLDLLAEAHQRAEVQLFVS